MNNNLIDENLADEIARRARLVAETQRSIQGAERLIDALAANPLAEIKLDISHLLRQEGYTCEISTPSAISLLRESIEIKQQQIVKASEWLRTALRE